MKTKTTNKDNQELKDSLTEFKKLFSDEGLVGFDLDFLPMRERGKNPEKNKFGKLVGTRIEVYGAVGSQGAKIDTL